MGCFSAANVSQLRRSPDRPEVGGRLQARCQRTVRQVLRAAADQPVPLTQLSTDSTRLAAPVREQQVFAHNKTRPNDTLSGAYASEGGFAFDFPFVVLTSDQSRRDVATQVLESLQDQTGRQILSEAGFRTPDGVAGPALQNAAGLDASRERAGKAPTAKAVRAAVDSYVRVNRPTRLLAVLDVSGSMGRPVPGTGGSTRLDLAIRASVAGLAVYTDETAVGLWTFSTHLTPKRPTTDRWCP